MPGERHFKSIRQLTFGGENAEAYFSADGTELIFQTTRDGFGCDQIFRMNVDGTNQRLVSTGKGRTTCSFIYPDQPKILYSSSHATLDTCPPRPDMSRGYVWPLLPDFDIYVAGAEGENPTPLAQHPGYDAEAVISPAGDGIVFTSTRSGDIDIWYMKPDGTGLKQLTDEIGYDGGPFFSLDGQRIVYRSNHPTDPRKLADYKALLADNLVRPSVMDLRVMNRDGGQKRTLLSNGAANFAPYFHPDGKRIIFASNLDDPGGRNFDLYTIRDDGTHLERITFNPSFDAFPMFSHDGRMLVFASNRNGKNEGDTNVFIAEWTDEVEPGPEASLEGSAAIEAGTWSQLVGELAAPQLAGRGLGTPGLEQAVQIVSRRFESAGLNPAGDGGTYFQRFDAATSKTIESATLTVAATPAKLDEDFRPLPFSASGTASGNALFAGFGITSSEHDYDDYAGTDASGKVVVVFRFEPRRTDAKSKFDGDKPSRASDLRFKAINARHRGAAGLLIVNPPDTAAQEDVLHGFTGVPSDAGIPVAHLTWKAASRLFGADTLQGAYKRIEETEAPASTDLKTVVQLQSVIKSQTTSVANVVGFLPATAGDTQRAIVLGAHVDHLGTGGEGSLADSHQTGEPHLGADDNASGVATLVELAEALGATDRATNVYFVAFTGEESGLLGSHWFVEHPPVPRDSIEAMLNFDMVGRLRDGRLTVLGTGTAKDLVTVLRRAQVGLPLDLHTSADGYGPSDQMAFYARKIPVLHFFTGAHEDYHRPSDTADKVNAEGAAVVTTLAYRVARDLVNAPAAYPYMAVKSDQAGDSGGDGRRGYGPYFGSIPAFGAEGVKGVKLSGARPGSPAHKAGIVKDDVIVKFGEHDVTTLKDYAFALRQHSPGDTVEVVLMRDGKEVKVRATLAKKKSGGKSPHGHGTSPHGTSPHSSAESGPTKSSPH